MEIIAPVLAFISGLLIGGAVIYEWTMRAVGEAS